MRRTLYLIARLLGDMNAARRGCVARRAARRNYVVQGERKGNGTDI